MVNSPAPLQNNNRSASKSKLIQFFFLRTNFIFPRRAFRYISILIGHLFNTTSTTLNNRTLNTNNSKITSPCFLISPSHQPSSIIPSIKNLIKNITQLQHIQYITTKQPYLNSFLHFTFYQSTQFYTFFGMWNVW